MWIKHNFEMTVFPLSDVVRLSRVASDADRARYGTSRTPLMPLFDHTQKPITLNRTKGCQLQLTPGFTPTLHYPWAFAAPPARSLQYFHSKNMASDVMIALNCILWYQRRRVCLINAMERPALGAAPYEAFLGDRRHGSLTEELWIQDIYSICWNIVTPHSRANFRNYSVSVVFFFGS